MPLVIGSMRALRIIFDGFRGAAWNMAFDLALLEKCARDGVATLRIYGFSPSAVTLGRFRPLSDVDLEAAAEAGVDVVRRPSGGGTVFHDEEGEVTYSVAVPLDWVGEPWRLYRAVCGGLAGELQGLGLDASYKEPNDVLVGGLKVSGSAQVVRGGCVLQHGTLMYATRLWLLKRLVPGARRVTTLSEALGRSVGYVEAARIIVSAVEKGLGVEASPGGFGLDEMEAARRLRRGVVVVSEGKRV